MIGRNFSPCDTEQQATSSTRYDCPGLTSTARCTISFRTCQWQHARLYRTYIRCMTLTRIDGTFYECSAFRRSCWHSLRQCAL